MSRLTTFTALIPHSSHALCAAIEHAPKGFTMTTSSTTTASARPVSPTPYLTSGLIGGLVALVFNVVLYSIGAALAGGQLLVVLPGSSGAAPLPLMSVVVLSLVPGIAAGAAYWGLHRMTKRPTAWLLAFAALAYLAFLPGPFNVATGTTIFILELMHVTTAVPILWFVLRAGR